MWSCHEALAFGRKGVQVTVLRLGWNPRASTPGLVDTLFRRREAAPRAPTRGQERPSTPTSSADPADGPGSTPPGGASVAAPAESPAGGTDTTDAAELSGKSAQDLR
jgi:hypothetical protein